MQENQAAARVTFPLLLFAGNQNYSESTIFIGTSQNRNLRYTFGSFINVPNERRKKSKTNKHTCAALFLQRH
jgi:hypothetical protein